MNTVEGNFMLLHQNIRSFDKNYDVFSIFAQNICRQIDVIVFTETWFREGNCSDISGYKLFHCCRGNQVGGGVSVYVRESFEVSFEQEQSIVLEMGETCVIHVRPNKQTDFITVIGLYKPPNAFKPLFMERMSKITNLYRRSKSVIVGDFNIDLLDDVDSLDLCEVLFAGCFLPIINIPSRVSDTSAKCIDHIWYNSCLLYTSDAADE